MASFGQGVPGKRSSDRLAGSFFESGESVLVGSVLRAPNWPEADASRSVKSEGLGRVSPYTATRYSGREHLKDSQCLPESGRPEDKPEPHPRSLILGRSICGPNRILCWRSKRPLPDMRLGH